MPCKSKGQEAGCLGTLSIFMKRNCTQAKGTNEALKGLSKAQFGNFTQGLDCVKPTPEDVIGSLPGLQWKKDCTLLCKTFFPLKKVNFILCLNWDQIMGAAAQAENPKVPSLPLPLGRDRNI